MSVFIESVVFLTAGMIAVLPAMAMVNWILNRSVEKDWNGAVAVTVALAVCVVYVSAAVAVLNSVGMF